MAEHGKLTARCPECGADLVIDASTGAVLSHRKAKQPPAGGKDFDALLKGLDEDKSRAEDIFEREVPAGRARPKLQKSVPTCAKIHFWLSVLLPPLWPEPNVRLVPPAEKRARSDEDRHTPTGLSQGPRKGVTL
jgi:hypothetical protein